MGTATFKVAKYIARKIKSGTSMMNEYPQYRDEYLEEITEYSKILYEVLKEATLP